jgi:ubiquinone/menaquinone biosynthesis C-methylase UbiE
VSWSSLRLRLCAAGIRSAPTRCTGCVRVDREPQDGQRVQPELPAEIGIVRRPDAGLVRRWGGLYGAGMSGLFDTTAVPDAYERYLVEPIFGPWVHVLLDYAGVSVGDRVLDVASGTGVVARLAAERVGDSGRVLATDVSPGMLAVATAADARVETLAAAARDLSGAGGGFDVAVCQQGFQFLLDRVAAAQAMGRAVRKQGRVAVAEWLSGSLLEPFDIYGQALEACGLPEPFPRAYAYDFSMSVDELTDVLIGAGLQAVEVTCRDLELDWPSNEQAVRGIAGTPYGPPASNLAMEQQTRLCVASPARPTDLQRPTWQWSNRPG